MRALNRDAVVKESAMKKPSLIQVVAKVVFVQGDEMINHGSHLWNRENTKGRGGREQLCPAE